MTDFPISTKQHKAIVEAEKHRIALLEGAVRSGKTFAVCLAFFGAVRNAPRSGLILITGRTLQTIERNIIEPMMDGALFGTLAAAVEHTRGSSTARVLGREVHLVGANDARAEEKLRGLTACLAMCDEATLLPEAFWAQLLARLSVPGARLIATTNPGSPRHWLKTKYLDRADKLDMVSFKFRLDDNPSLTETYKNNLKAEQTGLFYRRNINGEWVAAEGSVYPMFDPTKHVMPRSKMPQMHRVLALGIDYGDTHRTAGILLGLGPDPRGADRLYVLAEWAPPAVTIGEMSKHLRDWMAGQPEPEWIPYDHAAAAFGHQLRTDGFSGVMRAHKSVMSGIRVVGALLAADRLVIADDATNLLDEVPSYTWDPKATERGEDSPVKADDDFVDAARYAIFSTLIHWRDAVPLTAPGADTGEEDD
ncbi:PBSX family phage terminase large subunit [Xylanimonas ulmi]|uniref:PBSX family phage terminase large subunit n=1 Tax=Xylanimonas ulmi TaxID=228973 RepID=A0A4Q7M1H3_9MICO|nr:terminase family protein [Xylanibacterium ulmi]RZS61675.1 PBSX family phage terminase large subunit [Xylanibacterium ulmi]